MMISRLMAAATLSMVCLPALASIRHRRQAVSTLVAMVLYAALGPWTLLVPVLYLASQHIMASVRLRQQRRLKRNEFPHFIDSLCLSYAAGASLDAAVQCTLLMLRGPLKTDARKLVDDLNSANNWREPLRSFARRTQLIEATRLAESLIREHVLGVSPVATLNRQYELLTKQRLHNLRKRNAMIPYALTFLASVLLLNCILLLALPNVAAILKSLGPL